ncbi:MAG: CotH kinase family protein, partial [Eubacterium sp.]|nr:CotH kinase family protein [Eubacterium sp.]
MDTNILKRYQKSSTDISDYLVKPFYTTPYYYSYFDSYLDANGEFTLESLSSILYQNAEGVWQVTDPLTRISGMWENDPDVLQDVAEMIPTMLNWERKLTCLSKGTDVNGNTIDVNSNEYLSMVEDVFGDVNQVLRYFASHSYIIQMDNMFTWRQNFGLYLSKDGKAQIVPWDYDLAWGGLGEPNTTEEIANWNRDIMYNDVNPYCGENNKPLTYYPASYYSSFQGTDSGWYDEVNGKLWNNVGTPLFNVLFQNNTLCEKYHQYMNDCSIITTLGGTTSEGNEYSTGRFYSTMMDTLYEKMKTAAGETLADNVYYLNGIQQPEAVTTAMPELAELISLRAVGVWLQNHSISSKVSAGETSGGNLTIVDAATGIFASAEYEEDGIYPSLTVGKETEDSTTYNEVKNKIDSTLLEGKELNIYHLADTKTPKEDKGYTLYLPVSGVQAIVYQYDGTSLKVLDTFSYEDANIAVAQVSDFNQDIVVVDYPRKDEEAVEPITPWNASIDKDENVDSVDIYYTSTYGETPDETNVTTASARNSKTGELDISGDGQINFRVNVKDGYEIDQVTVTPVENYKNLKTPVDTNAENVYRITKIQGDISIVIS